MEGRFAELTLEPTFPRESDDVIDLLIGWIISDNIYKWWPVLTLYGRFHHSHLCERLLIFDESHMCASHCICTNFKLSLAREEFFPVKVQGSSRSRAFWGIPSVYTWVHPTGKQIINQLRACRTADFRFDYGAAVFTDGTWAPAQSEFMHNPCYWDIESKASRIGQNFARARARALLGLYRKGDDDYLNVHNRRPRLADELLSWPCMQASAILAREANRKKVRALLLCCHFHPRAAREAPFGSEQMPIDAFGIILDAATAPPKWFF